MLHDHPQESPLKSSFFSKSPQYPLEINSVYRPKFSKIVCDKFFNKPFYQRENKGPQNTEEKQVRAKVDQVMKQFNGKENATSEEDAVDAEVAGKELPPLEDSDVHVETLQNSEVRSDVVKEDIDDKDHSSTNVSTKVVNNTIPSGTKRKDTIGQHFVHKRGPANGSETAAQSQAPLQQQLFGAAFPQIQPIFVPSALPSFATPSLTSPLAPFPTSHPFIANQRFKFTPHVQDKSIDGSAQVPQNAPASVAGCYGVPQNNSGKEYYVMVHVDAGEVFSIRIGDHVQHIPGPATVRLVSNTGPPLPMPIHVPAGHLVQQIVDEEGILTHMILSPFPGPPSPYLKDGAPIMPSPGSSTDVSNGPHLPTNKQLPRIFPNASERPGAPLFCGGSIGGAYQPGPRRSGFGAQLPPLQPHHLQASVTHIGIPLTTQPYQQLQSNTTGSGFNVVISPKTSPGLAVAGPTAASPVVPWQPSLPQLSEVNVAMAPPLILGTAGAEQSKCPVISANGTAFTEKMETGTKVCKNDTVGTETAVNGSKIYDKETASVPPDDAVDEHDRNDCSPEEAPKSSPVIGCEPEPLRNGLPSPDSKKPRKKKDSKSLTAKKTGRSPDSSRSMDECAAKATAAVGGGVEINEQSNVASPTKSSSCDPKVSPTAPNRSSTSSRKNPTGAKRKTVPQNKINQNCTGASPSEADALVSKATTHLQTSPNLKMSKDQSAETSVCSTDASSKTTTTTPSTAGVNTPSGSGGGGDKKGTEAGLMMHFPGLLPGGVFPLCPSHPHHHHPLVPQFYGAPSLPFHPDQISSMTLRPGFFAGPPQFHPSTSAPPGTSSQPGPPPPAPPPPPPTFMAPFNPYFIPHPTMLPPHSVYHYPCEFLAGPPQFKPTSSFTEEECAAILKVLSKISQPKISSVDCRSVTINLSIPENLSIVPTEAATTQVAPASGTAVMSSATDTAAAPTAANMDALVPNANPSDSATQTDPVLQSRIWSISPSDLRFGLYLAENDGVFNCVYLGETPCILLQDLRPAVRYFIKACCIYEGLMGSFSETADFVTLSTKPSVLRPPVVMSKTKNSLSIRWTSAADNGSRITEYCLQFATLPKAGNLPVFYNCYKGPQRFHKLNHLNPSTSYLLRVCATNSHGQSPWSDAVSATTSGLPPPTPEPPHLLEATSQSLRLSWRPRTPPPPQSNQNSAQAGEEQNPEETKVRSPRRGVRHVLEMLDTETKQQQQQQQSKQQSQQRFKQVYEGEALECLVEGLRRSSLYRFRLAAGNSDGLSAWSDPVAFRTAPDNPSAPRSLRLRGRVRPYQVNLCWLLPDDDGGLPVQSYRLEVQLARLPTSVLLRQLRTTHDATDAPLSADAPAASVKEQTELGQTAQTPICWPWVIAPIDDTTFTSRPPSSLVLQTPSAALTGLCISKQSVLRRVPSNPKLPRRVTSSAKAVKDRCGGGIAGEDCIGGGDEDVYSFNDSSPSGSDSDAEQQHGQQELAWYSIYEGRAKEVTVCNLTPGLTLQFRVRATSERPEGPSAKTTDTPQLPRQISWGPASPCPLKLTTPAVPPMNPPANIRLYGRPRPNGLRIIWDPPASNGGAPIVSYELWQSVSDPLSGSPLNSPTRSNPRTNPASGSMCNLASVPTTTAVVKAAVSAPTTAASSPVHKVHSSSGRGPLPATPHAPKTPASVGQLVYSGPEADCWVGGLRAGQAYAFRARAKNATGWSGWSAWQTLSTAASPPEEPRTPPRVLPLSPTSVSVAWDPVVRVNGAEVTEYRVEWQSTAPGCEIVTNNTADDELGDVLESNLVGEYRNASCGPRNPSPPSTSCSKSSVCQCSSFQLVYTGLERRFELHNIQPASHLSFRVCAVNSAGAGGWSSLGKCVMPPSYPDQPYDLGLDRSLHNESTFPSDPVANSIAMVDGVSLSSANLIWMAPLDNGCPITHYNLEVAKYNDVVQPNVDGAPQRLRLCLECGDHHCRSTGGYPRELTLPDDVCFAQSPATGACQGSAENAAFRSCSPDAAEIGSVLSVPGARTDSKSTKSVRFTLTGLQPDTKYRVRIQAVNAVGEGPFSGFFHFSTLPPLPPAPILSCFGSTAGGIKLHWSLPPPVNDSTIRAAAAAPDLMSDQASAKWPPLRYTLEISRKPESKGWSVIYEGNQCAFKVRRLTEATAYYFRVVATNISGTGLFSPTLCVKTTYAPPPPVKAPSISEIGPTSCQVEWQPLNAMGQDPLIYVLQIMRVQHGSSDLDDKAVTVYRGAQTSYLLGGLSSGADYIARVCAIRLCQVPVEKSDLVPSPPSHSPSFSSSSSLKPNNCIASVEDVGKGSNNMERPVDCNNTNRPVDHCQPSLMQYRLVELAGPFSVGTAFTTVHEVRPTRATFDLRAFFTSTAETSPVLQIQLRNTAGTTATTTTAAPATLLHPVSTSCYRGKNSRLTSGLVLLASAFKQTVARLKHHTSNLAKDGGYSLRQLNGCVGLGSRRPRNSKVWTGITDKQAAVIFLVGFLVICLAVAWGFHQLWCSEESTLSNARVLWPPGGSVEDGIPSARAAFWSTNRYHPGAEAQPALQPQQQQNQP